MADNFKVRESLTQLVLGVKRRA